MAFGKILVLGLILASYKFAYSFIFFEDNILFVLVARLKLSIHGMRERLPNHGLVIAERRDDICRLFVCQSQAVSL